MISVFNIILFSLLSCRSFAQEERSAFERSLDRDTSVISEESWVDIKNVRYRKIEFNGGRYYVHFLKTDADVAEVYCEPPEGSQDEHLVDSESQTFRRTPPFVQAFHESCSKVHGIKKTSLKLNPAAGLEYPYGGTKTKRKKGA